MKKYLFYICIAVFLFTLCGCKEDEASETEYEILYKVQRTKENYYELSYELESVITYIPSYEALQKSFSEDAPLDKLHKVNQDFFEERALIFIDFCAEEATEAASLNIETIYRQENSLYICFTMNGYRNQGLEGNRFGVDYFISVKKADMEKLSYIKMKIENKYNLPQVQGNTYSEINNSDSYHVIDGETVGRLRVSPQGEYCYDFPTYAVIAEGGVA